MSLRAHVETGRLVIDEPVSLPDGTVLDLVLDDGGDDLSEQDRKALDMALSRSYDSAQAGRVHPASAIVQEIRSRR